MDINIHEVVLKLIWPIRPIGDSAADDKRYANLINMCELVNDLLSDIYNVHADYKDSYEHGVNRSSDYAKRFLMSLDWMI